jgi:hypothetical protein
LLTLFAAVLLLGLPASADVLFETLNNLVYESAVQTFAGSATPDWLRSDDFSFTLVAGKQYDIGAIAQRMRWYVRTIGGIGYSYTENGITAERSSTGIGNPDIEDFDNVYTPGHNSLFIPLKLEGSIVPTGVIPGPSTLGLLGAALAGAAFMRRRK